MGIKTNELPTVSVLSDSASLVGNYEQGTCKYPLSALKNLFAILENGQIPYSQTSHLTGNKNLYVDAALGDDANAGTQQAPFKTIQAALNAIPKDLSRYSVTIQIGAGSYNESVDIVGFTSSVWPSEAKQTIVLSGADKTTTVLTGKIRVSSAATVAIQSLTVQNSAGICVDAYSTTYVSNARMVGMRGVFGKCCMIYVDNTEFETEGTCVNTIGTAYLNNISGQTQGYAVTAGQLSPAQLPGLVVVGTNTITTSGAKYVKYSGGTILENGVLI